jgi:hypothetical protein
MVSQKIFRQVLTTHGFPLSESEVACVALVYGFQNNEVKYVEFLKDCNVLKYTINAPTTGIKSTYTPHFINFNGANEFNILMEKIKNIIKRDRIRLLEFFQDFDLLRKGTLQPSKFRSVLHTQKVQLTAHEYDILESTFAAPNTSNAPLVSMYFSNPTIVATVFKVSIVCSVSVAVGAAVAIIDSVAETSSKLSRSTRVSSATRKGDHLADPCVQAGAARVEVFIERKGGIMTYHNFDHCSGQDTVAKNLDDKP